MTPTTIRRALAIAALAATTAACATPGAAPTEPPAATTAAPAPTPGYDWFSHVEGGEASIAYGAPESDDVKLAFGCTAGSGQVEMSLTAEAGDAREIRLESGGEMETYPATAEPSELHDGVFLVARADAGDPVFQRFARVGWMAVWEDGVRHALGPQSGSAGGAAAFMAACG